MSLFKKPKKAVQQSRRVFTSELELMDIDVQESEEIEIKQKKKDKKEKEREREKSSKPQKTSLLSFGDEGILFGISLVNCWWPWLNCTDFCNW